MGFLTEQVDAHNEVTHITFCKDLKAVTVPFEDKLTFSFAQTHCFLLFFSPFLPTSCFVLRAMGYMTEQHTLTRKRKRERFPLWDSPTPMDLVAGAVNPLASKTQIFLFFFFFFLLFSSFVSLHLCRHRTLNSRKLELLRWLLPMAGFPICLVIPLPLRNLKH